MRSMGLLPLWVSNSLVLKTSPFTKISRDETSLKIRRQLIFSGRRQLLSFRPKPLSPSRSVRHKFSILSESGMKLLLFRIKQDFETVCWKKQLLTLEKSTATPRLSQSFQLLQRLLPKLSLPERQLPGEAQTMLPSICNSGILIRIRKSHPPQKDSSFPSAGKSLGRIKIKPSVQLFKSSDISSQPEIPTDHSIAAGISVLKALLFWTQALRAKKEDAFLPQSKHVRALPHISENFFCCVELLKGKMLQIC